MTIDVRPAREADLPLLAAIEDSGLPLFEQALGDLTGTVLGAPAVRGESRAQQDGFLLVAGTPEPIGFAHVVLHEGQAHLEQLSVRPEHGRRGVGTALVEAACRRVATQGHRALTLLTYADLPWNAPYYARLGFVEVPPEQRSTWQTQLVAHEAEIGLDRFGRRVLMRRHLGVD